MSRFAGRRSSRIDGASLAAYRIMFAALLFVGVARFDAYGWIDEMYVQPAFHFTYYGFDWIRPLPGDGMSMVFAVMAGAALMIAAGFFYRAAIAVFFVAFTYVELVDSTYYLNHYYLVSLLALLGIFLPLHRAWSVDALRERWSPEVPVWALYAMRAQVGLVYFFAGVAKLDAEWLFDAQPLTIWLTAHADLPLIGPWLTLPWVPYVASWSAAIFDLTIVFFLCWRRTRVAAFAVVVIFHVATAKLFFLGMFPWIMIANATLFLSPSWPRRFVGEAPVRLRGLSSERPARWPVAVLAVYFAVQLFLPLRHHLYPGDAGVTEEGGRFAWRVMLKEKSGFVVFHVSDDGGRRWEVYPRDYLTPMQAKMMAVDPEMIRQLAHHVRQDYEARGRGHVEVRAEAYLSVHGAPSRPLVDPTVDLAREPARLGPQPWILR